jgi:hypothetical protein
MDPNFQKDERLCTWKVLLPADAYSHILALGVSEGIVKSLLRSYGSVDTEIADYTGSTTPAGNGNAYSCVILAADRFVPLSARLINEAQTLVVLGKHEDARLRSFSSKRLLGIPAANPRIWMDLASANSRRAAFEMHRPGRFRARLFLMLLKAWSRFSPWMPISGRLVTIYVRGSAPAFLDEPVRRLFGESIRYSTLYSGSDAPERKITACLKLQSGREIIAKIADTDAGREAIQREFDTLEWLKRETSVSGSVPACLGSVEQGALYVQFQTAIPKGRYDSQLRDEHRRFLNELYLTSRRAVKLRELPLYQRLAQTMASDGNREAQKIFRYLSDRGDATIQSAFAHGDFAPWNCVLANNQLYVYDWEASDRLAPAGLDVFHFLYRQARLIGPWLGLDIIVRKWRQGVQEEVRAEEGIYLALYLLREYGLSGRLEDFSVFAR